MNSIVLLANEIPLIMAPASIIGAVGVIGLIKLVLRITDEAFKIMMIWIFAALSGAGIMLQFILQA